MLLQGALCSLFTRSPSGRAVDFLIVIEQSHSVVCSAKITLEKSQINVSEMIPDKAPKEDVLHGSEELKKEAHISSFKKYKDLYLKSIENPDGK